MSPVEIFVITNATFWLMASIKTRVPRDDAMVTVLSLGLLSGKSLSFEKIASNLYLCSNLEGWLAL